MTVHSKIGPSSLHRLLNCPASYKLSQKYPAGGSSFYAAEGTVAHSIIETELEDSMVSGVPKPGTIIEEEGHQIIVDDEMISGVEQMIAFCDPLKEGADLIWVEARVDLGSLWNGKPPEPIFGTVDFAAYDKDNDVLYVVDFKYGRIPVSPFDNPQAMAYALGACFQMGRFPKHVVMVIIQPRGKDNNAVKISNITGLDLRLWADEVLKPGVDACFRQDAGFATGDHCRFCPAKIDCPALYALAKKASRVEFGEMPADPMTYTDAQLGETLDQIEILSWWFEQVRAEASGRIEKGRTVPNWKLVPKRAMRKWEEGAEEHLLADGAYYELKPKSPAQVEKIDRKFYQEMVEKGFVSAQSSGTTLTPESDPRQAVKTKSAKEEFGRIE